LIRSLPQGKAAQSRIPLRCFAAGGAQFDQVGTPLRLTGGKGLALTLRSAKLEPAGNIPAACPK
jgi:beta-glucosidase